MSSRRRIACALALSLWVPAAAAAQPQIAHAGLECIEPGIFAVVLSGIDPGNEIQTAKVYFRSSLYPDFYYVVMKKEADRFVGILPQVSTETPQVIYYVEAVDNVFESARSAEFDPVVDDCDDDPAAAYFLGEEPAIIVGATTAGSSALPPGFSAVGIVGTITAAGVSSGLGGGVGAGVAVAAGAAAAGVAGAVVATSPSAETTTTAVVAAPPTTVTTTTVTTTTAPPGATTTVPTTTVPGSPPPTTTVLGSPTTTTTAGGPSTTSSSTSSTTSTSSSTTSSTSTTTTTAPALNAACFSVQVIGDCRVRLDASCVALPVDRYEWELDSGGEWQYVYIGNGSAVFTHTFSNCGENSKNIKFNLTVYRGGDSSSATKSIVVPGNDLRTVPPGELDLVLSGLLELPARGVARARVSLDGAVLSPGLVGGQPAELRARVGAGVHEMGATILGGEGIPGLLQLDLGGTTELVPGSLRASEGSILTLGANAITFRLSGQPGERVNFTFEIRE